jgi:uncharacterized cupin superfamily protein
VNKQGEYKMSGTFIRLLPDGDPVSGMQPFNEVPSEAFTSGDHTELNHTFFSNNDESTQTGVWECAPCIEEIDSYPVHEIMTILSGSLTLTNEEGESEIFTSGDTFFIPKGARITWQITEKLRKFYMMSS